MKDEKQKILEKIRKKAEYFEKLPEELKSNSEFVVECIKQNRKVCKYIDDEICEIDAVETAMLKEGYYSKEKLNDTEYCIKLAKFMGSYLHYFLEDGDIPQDIAHDKRFLKYAIVDCSSKMFQEDIFDDEEFMLDAIASANYYDRIDCAKKSSKRLLLKKDYVLKLIEILGSQFYDLYYNISEELRADLEVCNKILQYSPETIIKFPKTFPNYRNLVKEQLHNDKYLINHCCKDMQNDREFLIAALTNPDCAIDTLPEIFRGDKEIIMLAIKNIPLWHISEELKCDKEVVFKLLETHAVPNVFDYLPTKMRKNDDVIAFALKIHPAILQYLPAKYKNHRKIVLDAVEKDGEQVQYMPKCFRDDEQIIKIANRTYSGTINYASDRLKPSCLKLDNKEHPGYVYVSRIYEENETEYGTDAGSTIICVAKTEEKAFEKSKRFLKKLYPRREKNTLAFVIRQYDQGGGKELYIDKTKLC